MSVSDFSAYLKRARRMEKLEIVLDRARDVFIASQAGQPPEKIWAALAKLREAIADVDRTPPPHHTTREPA